MSHGLELSIMLLGFRLQRYKKNGNYLKFAHIFIPLLHHRRNVPLPLLPSVKAYRAGAAINTQKCHVYLQK